MINQTYLEVGSSFKVFQTVFVSNPFLGAFILLAIFISSFDAGLACSLGGIVATVVELLFQLHPWSLVENGVAPFNGALVGSVVGSLYPVFLIDYISKNEMFLAVAIGGTARFHYINVFLYLSFCFSVFLSSTLRNFMDTFSLPFMTLPFNIRDIDNDINRILIILQS